jgi:hypothetical protein
MMSNKRIRKLKYYNIHLEFNHLNLFTKFQNQNHKLASQELHDRDTNGKLSKLRNNRKNLQ